VTTRRERIADGCTLRRFADFYCQAVPKHDAFNRAFMRLTPATLRSVNALLVSAAVAVGLEDGSKLRVDTTVVQTDIHHPTDNTLLWDVVRVVTRLIDQLAEAIGRRIKGSQPHACGGGGCRLCSGCHDAAARTADQQVS
jgi:IS5 family transposase